VAALTTPSISVLLHSYISLASIQDQFSESRPTFGADIGVHIL
jgi:hypothetical protein